MELYGAERGSLANNPGDHTINTTFSFAKLQFETAIVLGIQELLLLPGTSLGMLLLPVLPCGTQKLMYCNELPVFVLTKLICGPGLGQQSTKARAAVGECTPYCRVESKQSLCSYSQL